MKNIFLSAILSVITLFAFATNPRADNVPVNAENSTVKWIGSKISENHEGIINVAKGYLVIENGTLVSGQVIIDMESIQTTDMSDKYNKKLDGHLKSKDFFNTEEFSVATITIKDAIRGEGNSYQIGAELTIKGITNKIRFGADVDVDGVNFLATANIKIDRTKWDIKYNSGNFFKDLGDKLILDEIQFDVSLQSVK
jgi:polyisoprenoid-binding protein YceI